MHYLLDGFYLYFSKNRTFKKAEEMRGNAVFADVII